MKRKPLRRISKKRSALLRAIGPDRRAYIHEFGACVACGSKRALSVHEIACGAFRAKAFAEPCTWLCLCFACNSGPFTDYSVWPLERQLALKLRVDESRFDLEKFNALRGRASGAITMEDLQHG